MRRVEVWSDIHCPWALVALHRLRQARARLGAELAEHVDYALRIAFFRDSVDVSIEAGLRRSLNLAREYHPGCDVDAVISAWRTQGVRSEVARDYQESQGVAIQGSPQILFPDGTSADSQGMTDHYWRGGLVRINSTDPGESGRLLSNSIADPAVGSPAG
jgi:predicted DsbA family dithiol-disulfide isomerase